MKKAIVIGSGAGGATAAKELQGQFDVTVLEAGLPFLHFRGNISMISKIKKTGIFRDERMIQWIFSAMKISKTPDKMVLVKGIGYGGTTTLSAGNRVRSDQDLKAIGINLDREFAELQKEIPENKGHAAKWHETTRQVFSLCREMGLQPEVTPRMTAVDRCSGCGRCVLGCPNKAKWDSRDFLNQALKKGAHLVSSCRVNKIVIRKGRTEGVETNRGFFPADLVVLAAGGLGTPIILQNSVIECRANLFVDPVLCVAARVQGSQQYREIPMPFLIQTEHYLISPYFDFLSFFFNRNWKYPAGNIYSLMIKLADANSGSLSPKRVHKTLTEKDREHLHEAAGLCTAVFRKMGLREKDLFLGTVNAGHPGGMLPLTEKESGTFHHQHLPGNLYVADASLFPRSLGSPPILTIAAMAKRVSRHCLQYA